MGDDGPGRGMADADIVETSIALGGGDNSLRSNGPELVIYRRKDQSDCKPAVDYERRTADKAKTGGWKPALIIYGTEICERIAGFAISQNLITYLTRFMHLPLEYSANVVTTYVGGSYMTFMIGGFIADTWLGRFRTLCLAITIQFLGLVLLAFTAAFPSLKPPVCDDRIEECQSASGWTLMVLFLGLSLVALGIGSIKSCVSAFGADQFDMSDPSENTHLPLFFNWFFFCVSAGGLLAVTLIVCIEDTLGHSWGFGALALGMLVSFFLFVSGRRKYRYRNPTGSPLTHILQVTAAAFMKRKLPHPSTEEFRRSVLLYIDDPQAYLQHYEKNAANWLFRFFDKASILSRRSVIKRSGTLDLEALASTYSPWEVASVEKVEEVKRIFRLCPTMATSLLYYTVLAQLFTFSVDQAETLERHLGSNFVMPSASVGLFLHLTVMFTIPLYEFVMKPLLRQITGLETGISILQRIGVGLGFSILAMITAALVEGKRLASVVDTNHATMSVFWLIPQYVLVGAGDVFAYIGHMEFFYNEAPKTMRTIGTGFFLFTLAMGYLSSSFIVWLLAAVGTEWFGIGMNDGTRRLDKFYWFMAIIASANLGVYIFVSRGYTYTYELYIQEYNTPWKFEHTWQRWSRSPWASPSPGSSLKRTSLEISTGEDRDHSRHPPSRFCESVDESSLRNGNYRSASEHQPQSHEETSRSLTSTAIARFTYDAGDCPPSPRLTKSSSETSSSRFSTASESDNSPHPLSSHHAESETSSTCSSTCSEFDTPRAHPTSPQEQLNQMAEFRFLTCEERCHHKHNRDSPECPEKKRSNPYPSGLGAEVGSRHLVSM